MDAVERHWYLPGSGGRDMLERTVLAGCLLDNAHITEVILIAPVFKEQSCALLWAGIKAQYAMGLEVIDIMTLYTDFCEGRDSHSVINTFRQISDLDFHPYNTPYYARKLKDWEISTRVKERLREVYLQTNESISRDELKRTIRDVTRELSVDGSITPPKHISELVPAVLQSLNERWDDPGLCEGIPCGLDVIDSVTKGFRGGELVVIAARPSVGKSAMALVWAVHMAQSYKVLFYSLEMSSRQLIERALMMKLERSTYDKILPHVRKVTVEPKVAELEALSLWIEETPNMGLTKLRDNLNKHISAHGKPEVLFVDYLQLMHIENRGSRGRPEEIGVITSTLKEMARTMNMPVILMSQLSRAADEGGMPKMSQLKDSGCIEQDADIVILLSRDKSDRSILCTNMAKNRDGPTALFKVRYDRKIQRIWCEQSGDYHGRSKQELLPGEETPF